MKWKVEMLFLYGWDDAGWVVGSEEIPQRFDTRKECEDAIAEHIGLCEGAGMDDKRSDYRAVEVDW